MSYQNRSINQSMMVSSSSSLLVVAAIRAMAAVVTAAAMICRVRSTVHISLSQLLTKFSGSFFGVIISILLVMMASSSVGGAEAFDRCRPHLQNRRSAACDAPTSSHGSEDRSELLHTLCSSSCCSLFLQ